MAENKDIKIKFYGEDNNIIIKEPIDLLVEIDDNSIIGNLSYDVKCENNDVEVLFVKNFYKMTITEEDDETKVTDKEIYSLGSLIVNKIKFDDNDKKDININLTWTSGIESGVIDGVFHVLTNDVYKKLSLPLYYRPFYTNAVLLLTPKYMTDGEDRGAYNYDITKLHEYWTGTGTTKPTETKTNETVITFSGSTETNLYDENAYSDSTSPINGCYGRLFYSIANGCSMVEQIDETNNIYKLDKVSLSYMDRKNNKSGTFTIKKPFRCYSEMESADSEKTIANKFSHTTQTSRMMMYGITEPFVKRETDGNVTIKEIRYITQEIGSTTNYLYSSVGNVRRSGKIKRTIEWEHNFITSGTTENGNTRQYKLVWTITHKKVKGAGGRPKNDRFNNIFKIYDITNNETVIGEYESDYLRTSKKWVIGGTMNPGDIEWTINFNISDANRGNSSITVIGKYIREYTPNFFLKREGLPVLYNDIDIEQFNLSENENFSTIDEGIRNIYCSTNNENYENSNGKIIQIKKSITEEEPIIFDTSSSLDISLNIKEGYPDGEEDNASTIDIGYNNVKFYDDINLGVYWVSTKNEVFNENPVEEEYENWTNAYGDVEKLKDGYYVRITNDEKDDNGNVINSKGIYKVILTTKKDENNNDVDVKELLYYCESIEEKNGLSVQGYSSKNVRYIALGNFGDADTTQKPVNIKNKKVEYKWGNEPENIIKSIYEIDVLDGGEDGGTSTPQIRYAGLNTNDYLGEISSPYSGMRTVKYSGWKGIQTYLKKSKGAEVKLSGAAWNGGGNHSKIDITNILREVYNDASVKKEVPVNSDKRMYVIGICDNYTNLSDEDYDIEKKNMYSIIKSHTSRFSIIKLYKLKNDEQ